MQFYETPEHSLAAAITLPMISSATVALRFYTRKKQKLPPQIDDWLTLPPLVLFIGACIATIVGVQQHALGYPTPDVPIPEGHFPGDRPDLFVVVPVVVVASRVEYALQIMGIPALGFIKMSILFFYYRIFCPQKTGPVRIVIFSIMGLVILWTVCNIFPAIFPCGGNFNAFFGSTYEIMMKCLDVFLWLYILAFTDLLTDLMVLILPMPLLWKIRLPLQKKFAISSIFVLGSLATLASAVRLVITARYYYNKFAPPPNNRNETITGVIYWTLVEIGIGLFAACLPTIQFLFRDLSLTSKLQSVRSRLSQRDRKESRSHFELNDRSGSGQQ